MDFNLNDFGFDTPNLFDDFHFVEEELSNPSLIQILGRSSSDLTAYINENYLTNQDATNNSQLRREDNPLQNPVNKEELFDPSIFLNQSSLSSVENTQCQTPEMTNNSNDFTESIANSNQTHENVNKASNFHSQINEIKNECDELDPNMEIKIFCNVPREGNINIFSVNFTNPKDHDNLLTVENNSGENSNLPEEIIVENENICEEEISTKRHEFTSLIQNYYATNFNAESNNIKMNNLNSGKNNEINNNIDNDAPYVLIADNGNEVRDDENVVVIEPAQQPELQLNIDLTKYDMSNINEDVFIKPNDIHLSFKNSSSSIITDQLQLIKNIKTEPDNEIDTEKSHNCNNLQYEEKQDTSTSSIDQQQQRNTETVFPTFFNNYEFIDEQPTSSAPTIDEQLKSIKIENDAEIFQTSENDDEITTTENDSNDCDDCDDDVINNYLTLNSCELIRVTPFRTISDVKLDSHMQDMWKLSIIGYKNNNINKSDDDSNTNINDNVIKIDSLIDAEIIKTFLNDSLNTIIFKPSLKSKLKKKNNEYIIKENDINFSFGDPSMKCVQSSSPLSQLPIKRIQKSKENTNSTISSNQKINKDNNNKFNNESNFGQKSSIPTMESNNYDDSYDINDSLQKIMNRLLEPTNIEVINPMDLIIKEKPKTYMNTLENNKDEQAEPILNNKQQKMSKSLPLIYQSSELLDDSDDDESNDDIKSLKCINCNKIFKTSMSLKIHRRKNCKSLIPSSSNCEMKYSTVPSENVNESQNNLKKAANESKENKIYETKNNYTEPKNFYSMKKNDNYSKTSSSKILGKKNLQLFNNDNKENIQPSDMIEILDKKHYEHSNNAVKNQSNILAFATSSSKKQKSRSQSQSSRKRRQENDDEEYDAKFNPSSSSSTSTSTFRRLTRSRTKRIREQEWFDDITSVESNSSDAVGIGTSTATDFDEAINYDKIKIG